jgi:hypothetical protein
LFDQEMAVDGLVADDETGEVLPLCREGAGGLNFFQYLPISSESNLHSTHGSSVSL